MKQKYNYLVVDDEASISRILIEMLSLDSSVKTIFSAKDGMEALDILKNNQIDILFTDVLMPRLSGIELIKEARKIYDDTQLQIVVISAFNDMQLLRDAMHYGAYDYILKPFTIDDIMHVTHRILERIQLILHKKNYLASLEQKVQEATKERNKAFFASFTAMVMAIDARDKYTHMHSENVAKYSVQIGKLLSLSETELDHLKIAGILHDIGKIGIPDSILFKPGRLTEQEFQIIKTHPTLGKDIVEPTMKDFPNIVDFVFDHHERFDGKGYPRGLKGDQLPLFGKISNIADAFDTMLSKRVYKEAKSMDDIIEDIRGNLGAQFDPEIGKIFLEALLGKKIEI